MSAVKAIKIYQRVLDIVSAAVLKGDHATVNAHLSKPFHMRTVNGWFPLNTEEDIEQMVRSTHLSLNMQGATDYVRIARSAEFMEDGSVEGVHISHILRNGTPLVPSYENRMRIKKIGDDWQVTMAKHAMDNFKWPISLPDVDKGDLNAVETSAEIDGIAMECYQAYLDKITAINVAQDFDAWIDVCEFPHMVQIDRVNRLIETPDDIRQFFNMVSGLLTENPTAVFNRKTEFAGFLDSHTIRGYHTGTMEGPDGQVFPPVRSRMTIRFKDRKWRMIEVVNSIANTEFPYTKPIVSERLASEFHHPKKVK